MNGSQLQPTLIGRVRHVLGAHITAELLPDVAGTTPVYRGRVYQVGQIGSLVRVPQGTIDLIGAVTMLGIAELITPTQPAIIPQQGDRWIQFQLLGELDAFGRFQRGVSNYPAIDDPIHFATHEQIAAIFPPPGHGRIKLGSLSTSRGDPVYLDLGRLVTRHSAVVGSTGSGKSSTVARVLQSIISAGLNRANVVVIDPHGEHSVAVADHAVVNSIAGTNPLFVPYWALSLDDLLQVYSRGSVNPVVKNRVQELVLQERQSFLQLAGWAAPSPDDITVDTPVPFDLREVWYKLDFENRATYPQQNNQGSPCVLSAGDAKSLTPARFQSYALGSTAPFKGRTFGQYSPLPDRLRVRLSDPRFTFLSREWPDPTQQDPLPGCVSRWLGDERPISILDFSGVPAEAADVAIGAILNLLFIAAATSTPGEGVGRARPVLVVLEEAHRFLGKVASTSAGLAEALPSLRTGEALVTGEAIALPSRVLVDRPNPEPHASDPLITSWLGDPEPNEVEPAIARWRGVVNTQHTED